MSCNCSKIYKFPNPISSCQDAGFLKMFSGLDDGNYTVQLDYLNGIKTVGISVADNVVTLTGSLNLNESFTYTGRVVNAAGAFVTLYYSTVAYDCFQFDTKIFL